MKTITNPVLSNIGLSVALCLGLSACGSALLDQDSNKPTLNQQGLLVVSSASLDADGPVQGQTAYQLITQQFGKNAAESPDLFSGDHQGETHILEKIDPVYGPYFRFILHRDLDGNKGKYIDRQRNEIKIYGGSSDRLKGLQNSHFEYSWKFRVSEDMQVTNKFTHIFQLKAVGGEDAMPIITLTGNTRRGEAGLEVRHSPERKTKVLARTDWQAIRGEWLEAKVQAHYSEQGWFSLRLTHLSDGSSIFNFREDGLDMWRGTEEHHFVRPKWGIYRSLVEAHKLNPQVSVDFANFSIQQFATD
ncbi:heparin lyase I family protein [Agarivorans sp. Alg241-V36]|uniref:heparin lyase I family protein n=1 Tax=Agarivorans sp. Alg241-V36 TaxID=2305992 RepID=UPI0013D753D7|nr:heparin lyase I family protein [Agarivorans sp. Alg241-V36]